MINTCHSLILHDELLKFHAQSLVQAPLRIPWTSKSIWIPWKWIQFLGIHRRHKWSTACTSQDMENCHETMTDLWKYRMKSKFAFGSGRSWGFNNSSSIISRMRSNILFILTKYIADTNRGQQLRFERIFYISWDSKLNLAISSTYFNLYSRGCYRIVEEQHRTMLNAREQRHR